MILAEEHHGRSNPGDVRTDFTIAACAGTGVSCVGSDRFGNPMVSSGMITIHVGSKNSSM